MTVRDLKDQVRQEANAEGLGEFGKISEGHMAFWTKLNTIGWKKKTKQPGECADVDATAELTDAEHEELLAEFRALPR